MIFDSIQNKKYYKDFQFLYLALDYLSKLEADTLPQPNTILIPDILFCNPVLLVSKPEEDCLYEAHRNYIDLHYIVKGIEGIATCDISSLSEATPFDCNKDIGFFTGIEDGRYYLKPGQFMVCWPHDAHKVGIMKEEPSSISKIVFKIRMEG